MKDLAIQVEGLSKVYHLGEIGTGTISHDLERWWAKVRGKEDPFLSIAEINDRSSLGKSDIVLSLKDINFEVEQGDAMAIIGRNGAGKSTLLKILSRITTPTSGSVSINGRVASLLEVGTGFHPELTGRENIFLNGAILGMRKGEIKRQFDEIVNFAGIERYVDTPVKRYSSGMYVRLAFAVAAHLESEILIVDEVLAVGDYEFQQKCISKMDDVSSGQGRTVLFVSHNMSIVKNLCKKGILLKNGELFCDGTIEEVVNTYSSIDTGINAQLSAFITKAHRKFDLNLNVEFVEVSLDGEDNLFATDEPIIFKFTLKGNKTVDTFRIAFGIYKFDDTKVGVFFSEETLSIQANEIKHITLILKNHQMAKGKYFIDFSIGKGNEKTGITEYDNIHKPINFEIAYKHKATKEMYAIWPDAFGPVNFQDYEIIES